jgi:hypothetical protein
MSEADFGIPGTSRERALEAALTRALRPPSLPADFHQRLQQMLARAAADPVTDEIRSRLERERLEQLAALEAGYLRLRRRTLGTLVGGAFAAGAGVALALPWLRASFGPDTPLILASLGGAIGLVIAALSWMERPQAWNPLSRLGP